MGFFAKLFGSAETNELKKNGTYKIIKRIPAETRRNIKNAIDNGDNMLALRTFRDASELGLAHAKEIFEHPDFYKSL